MLQNHKHFCFIAYTVTFVYAKGFHGEVGLLANSRNFNPRGQVCPFKADCFHLSCRMILKEMKSKSSQFFQTGTNLVTFMHSGLGARRESDTKQTMSFSLTCLSTFVSSNEKKSSELYLVVQSDAHTLALFVVLGEVIGVECCRVASNGATVRFNLATALLNIAIWDFISSSSAVIGVLGEGKVLRETEVLSLDLQNSIMHLSHIQIMFLESEHN